MPKMVFGKMNYKNLKVEVPNGISTPFGKMPATPDYGAGNDMSRDTRKNWGSNSNRSGE